MSQDKRGAFTLVELLVVIGVIAVLVGLLLPALARARESAMQVGCASNLRQWTMALHMYVNHEKGWLPRRGQGVQPINVIDRPADWFNSLPPMLHSERYVEMVANGTGPRPGQHSIWICPAAIDGRQQYFFAYGMNMWISTSQAAQPDRINHIGSPSTMVFMADAKGSHCSVVPASADYSPLPRHGGRVNLAFIDGHVASYPGADIGCGAGDPLREDVRWAVPGSTWKGPNG